MESLSSGFFLLFLLKIDTVFLTLTLCFGKKMFPEDLFLGFETSKLKFLGFLFFFVWTV